MRKKFFIIFGILILVAVTVYIFRAEIIRNFYTPTKTTVEEGITKEKLSADIEVVAENMNIPWEIAFLSGGEILVTERPGRILKIGVSRIAIPITGVHHIGEGGLLGLVLHPKFEENQWIYLYLTTKINNNISNRVERYRLKNNKLIERTVILENIPGASYHDGGRIKFGPDEYLYITTGDAGRRELAQDINSLAGKILRVKDDGSMPQDNPFGSAVFSYGHRNSQGLAWDDQGRLWATEHGRSGILSGFDELNLIEKGGNYGWPIIQGDETQEDMHSPIIHSGPNETWAPAGADYLNGSIFFTGLRGESVYQAKISVEGEVDFLKAHFPGDFGRLRALKIGPDNFIYFSTSNNDGRGTARMGDDKIIRINPEALN